MLHFFALFPITHFYTKNTLKVNFIIFLINYCSVILIESFFQLRIISLISKPCFHKQNSTYKSYAIFNSYFITHFIANFNSESNSFILLHFPNLKI